jgi:hypothetical protein
MQQGATVVTQALQSQRLVAVLTPVTVELVDMEIPAMAVQVAQASS